MRNDIRLQFKTKAVQFNRKTLQQASRHQNIVEICGSVLVGLRLHERT